MGYKVLGNTEDILKGYGPRKGLEGPYPYPSGRVLYYDPKEGKYWDPKTDFYLEHNDVAALQKELIEYLGR